MRIRRTIRWSAFAVCLAIAAVSVAADDGRGGEIGFLLGGSEPDEDVFGPEADASVALGLRGGSVFAPRWGWFLDGLWTNFDSSSADTDVLLGRTGLDLLFMPERDNRLFVSFGGGLMKLERDGLSDFDGPMASLGLGMRYKLDGLKRLRWELRGDRGLDDQDFGGQEPTIVSFLLGVNWGPGSGEPADADGDGVGDRRDRCPDTPRGATVDERGCPKDSDGDGVADGIDACADTPRGWAVDARGCPKDSDGDGVADGEDGCPNTPRGARVDLKGCPEDSDGDGVPDGIDTCPDTPRGALVDAKGCPKDGDGDGVADGIDKCPNTSRGTAVKADGCARAEALFEEGEKTLVLEGVFFQLNSARLTPNSRTVLDRVARSLVDWPKVRVEVGGHTDSSGADSYNLDLSARRAEAVRAYLAGKGVAASRMTVRGYGESRPAATNSTSAGRAKNRRVELTRID